MTDSIVRRFKLVGELEDDSKIIQTQESCRNVTECQMRDEGFVPLYDIDPVWRTWLHIKRNVYEFSYTMQGVYVGEERAWHIKGVVNNRLVEKSNPTSQSKSEAS